MLIVYLFSKFIRLECNIFSLLAFSLIHYYISNIFYVMRLPLKIILWSIALLFVLVLLFIVAFFIEAFYFM